MGSNKKTYTKKEAAGYLTGMFGQNLIYNIVATGLYFYFQNVICLNAMALSTIFAVARVWDAVNDPMMGTIVDKTRSKWGKCRPYLLFFPAIIGIVTILCFINGNYAEAEKAGNTLAMIAITGWAAISYIAWGMVFTVCDIPLWGITSLMTEDENDRSKILGFARIVAGVGGIALVMPYIAQALAGPLFGDDPKAVQKAFIVTAIIMTVIATVLFEFAGIFTREKVDTANEKKYGFIDNFKIMFGNKPFRQILISGILRSPIQLQMVVMMTLVTYYYTNGDIMNVFADGINFAMIFGLLSVAGGIFIGQFVAMAITPMLTKKFEKKKLYNFFSVAGALPYALIFVLYYFSGESYKTSAILLILNFLCFLLSGAAMGAINVLQSVMIADCVDYEEYHNGVRTDGVFFSGQSFITKLSAGIATVISGVVYSYVGYSGAGVDAVNNALKNGEVFSTLNGGKYATAMFFLVSIPCAVGMVLSAIPTAKYAMTDKEHTDMLNVLIERRAAKDAEEPVDEAAQVLADNMESIVDDINNL